MQLDLEALETSFDLVAPEGDRLMDIVYARLFVAAPAVKALFDGTDLARQKRMLLAALVPARVSARSRVCGPEAARTRRPARRVRRRARALSGRRRRPARV
jgi:hypothetical protein